jgi:hypothetical protein
MFMEQILGLSPIPKFAISAIINLVDLLFKE